MRHGPQRLAFRARVVIDVPDMRGGIAEATLTDMGDGSWSIGIALSGGDYPAAQFPPKIFTNGAVSTERAKSLAAIHIKWRISDQYNVPLMSVSLRSEQWGAVSL